MPILHCQCHGCWYRGYGRRQGISSHRIDSFLTEYSTACTRRVQSFIYWPSVCKQVHLRTSSYTPSSYELCHWRHSRFHDANPWCHQLKHAFDISDKHCQKLSRVNENESLPCCQCNSTMSFMYFRSIITVWPLVFDTVFFSGLIY